MQPQQHMRHCCHCAAACTGTAAACVRACDSSSSSEITAAKRVAAMVAANGSCGQPHARQVAWRCFLERMGTCIPACAVVASAAAAEWCCRARHTQALWRESLWSLVMFTRLCWCPAVRNVRHCTARCLPLIQHRRRAVECTANIHVGCCKGDDSTGGS
ncbi:hypothetical protein COO60DRAFT_908153 [Scenedesmus sp. NREL 46B-D3]|nr:hypothetical protein COO60DRAFT_908153 [Scenedesmus sp. NREL 46B-D3]